MSKQYQVIHKKSNVLTNGQPKLPSASTIEYGEIAINYAKGGETMSIKNANNEIVTFSSDAKILGQIPAVANYFDGAEYDSNSKRINFKHGNTVKAYVDATDFIKDGMVDNVAVATPTSGNNSGVTCLVVTFNTESGKEDIEVPLSLIFNPSNYYDKTAADEKFLTISAYTEDEEVVAAALNDLNERIENIYVPHNVSDLYNDLGFVDSSHTHSQYATTAHTHTAAEVGAMATSERSNYATTAHTHTAAEVGAMATSERSNYSTTGHTHSQYATTAHTHTAAEVGAMATSERSNYATTAHTHTAAEVGAMATSERSNYLTTATTIPTESTISGSGFTKNAITGINVNGSATTVTGGVADITIPSGLPAVTAADNGKVAMVVNGQWTASMPTIIYTGTNSPDNTLGNDGDIYLQTS